MKTAEEWYVLETGRADMDWYVEQNKADYIERTKQIQLDAMKEGTRRGAAVCMQSHFIYQGGHGEAKLSPCVDYEKAILAAAERLTIDQL